MTGCEVCIAVAIDLRAALAKLRRSGRRTGRPKGQTDVNSQRRAKKIRDLWTSGEFKSFSSLAKRLEINRSTVSRALKGRKTHEG